MKEIGRVHAMGFAICPLGNPVDVINGRSCLISNESADTTDGEQRRSDEWFVHRSRRGLTKGPGEQFFKKHMPPYCSFTHPKWTASSLPDSATGQNAKLYRDTYERMQPFMELGLLPVPVKEFTSVRTFRPEFGGEGTEERERSFPHS